MLTHTCSKGTGLASSKCAVHHLAHFDLPSTNATSLAGCRHTHFTLAISEGNQHAKCPMYSDISDGLLVMELNSKY